MSQNGKGDKQRPLSVDAETYKSNWERIFGKKEQEPPKEIPQDIKEMIDEVEEKIDILRTELMGDK